MKRSAMIILVVLLAVIAALVGCSVTALAEPEAKSDTTRAIKTAHVSDIHIMVAEYCNIYSEAYRKAGRTSYKVLEQTEATAEAVFAEMYLNADGSVKDADEIPQYVFITGDLTSNGELANHMGVAQVLTYATQKIRQYKAGFQIFVIPGNHDIDNQGAKVYSPALDDEKWAQCKAEGNADKMIEYLSSLGARSVQTTTMLEFMSIYSDFGYCNCPDKNKGEHLAECGMADGVSLEFFYESNYWYEPNTTRSNRPVDLGDAAVALTENYTYRYEYANDNGALLEETEVPEWVQDSFKEDKDMEYYAPYSRHGACSYIARVGGLTVVGLDSNSHKYTGVKEGFNLAVQSSRGWHETTGGYVTKAQLCWLIDRLGTDVKNNQLIVSLAHENVLPHFDTEDEVISLFTYDNWEDVYTNMADNGMRYVLTGHQHTNDIESAVSQKGSVFYDVETGSTTCMGAGWRELDFVVTDYADGAYSEDVYSKMHYLQYNSSYIAQYGSYFLSSQYLDYSDYIAELVKTLPDAFVYSRYEVSKDGKWQRALVYQGVDGGETNLAEYMAHSLQNMITNIAGNFVNENLMDMLQGLTGGLSKYSDDIKGLADAFLADLGKLNLHKFIVDPTDGSFYLGDVSAEENLTSYAIKLVDYFLGYDYSFGKVEGGLHLDDVLLYVYGNHLIGAQDVDTVPADVQALLDALEDGRFLRYFEDLMLRGVMPQLEVILNAPIYWGDFTAYRHIDDASTVTLADVQNGKGFDLSAYNKILRGEFELKNITNPTAKSIIDTMLPIIKVIIRPNEGLPGLDVSSLLKLVRSLGDFLGAIQTSKSTSAAIIQGLMEEYLDESMLSYLDKGLRYISKLNNATLTEVIETELLDKYVTDAFCKNLGAYAAYIVRSVVLDDSPDGVQRLPIDKYFPYEVEEKPLLLQVTHDDITAMQGHTYYRDAKGNDTVKVVATTQNGLLPGKITLTNVIDEEGNLDVTKKEIRWFTQRDVDYTQVCKQFEQNNLSVKADEKKFQCELEYSTDKSFAKSTSNVYTGDNVWIEYPTVDLGIIYLNLTYAYRQYNDYEVVLRDLAPNTTYYYRIRAIDGDVKYDWTPVYQFTTGTTEGGFQVMAMTDIQGSIEQNYIASLPNMQQAIQAGDPDFVISCGDNVDKSENISQWEWLLDDQASVWASSTFVGLAGNHEDKHFSLSYVTATPDVAEVDETGYYYSYNYQNVHFVILNTNDIEKYEGDEDGKAYSGLGSDQFDWLVQDLAAAKQNDKIDFIVVALHKGPYTAGSHAFDDDVIGLRAQLTPVFATYGVDIVLQGHDHTYSVSEYIGGEYDEQKGLYGSVAVQYDATGAAIDPNGVLYVNLGTMGDKYYNYIYSPEVTLKDRSQDYYLQTVFASYFTDKGNFELSPVRNSKTVLAETPVYAYLTVEGKRLSFASYTVVGGKSYAVDTVTITKDPVTKEATAFTVLGESYASEDLAALRLVRLSVELAEGTTYYDGYYLADLYAAKAIDKTTVSVNGTSYDVDSVFVAVSQADSAFAQGESVEPLFVAFGAAGEPTYIVEAPKDVEKGKGKPLPAWATVIIVLAAVLVAGGLVAIVLLGKRSNAPKESASQEADDAAQEQADEKEEQGDETQEEGDDSQQQKEE